MKFVSRVVALGIIAALYHVAPMHSCLNREELPKIFRKEKKYITTKDLTIKKNTNDNSYEEVRSGCLSYYPYQYASQKKIDTSFDTDSGKMD